MSVFAAEQGLDEREVATAISVYLFRPSVQAVIPDRSLAYPSEHSYVSAR
jgi:hypothetical protein